MSMTFWVWVWKIALYVSFCEALIETTLASHQIIKPATPVVDVIWCASIIIWVGILAYREAKSTERKEH